MNLMNTKILFLAITALYCLGFSASALAQSRQMYSWTDENGVVHFTDQRPAGEEVTVLDIPDTQPQAIGDPLQQAEAGDEASPGQQRRDELNQRRQEAQTQADKYEVECASMRALVERFEPHRRVFYVNEEGERVRMDDVERADRVAEAKAFIDGNCN